MLLILEIIEINIKMKKEMINMTFKEEIDSLNKKCKKLSADLVIENTKAVKNDADKLRIKNNEMKLEKAKMKSAQLTSKLESVSK
mgnify:CR=1 FL=1